MKLFKNALLCIVALLSVSTASAYALTQIELNNQLMSAVADDQLEDVVKIVLFEDVDADAVNRAFMFSAQHGQTEMVAFFILYAEVDVNARDIGYQTALIQAASKGHIDTVNFLIAMDADVNLRDSDGRTALVYAELAGHTEVVETLIAAGA